MTGVLLYDADCGLCAASARLAGRLGCDLDAIPWQEWPELSLHGISPAAAHESLHVVAEQVYVGDQAVSRALRGTDHSWSRALGRLIGSRPVRPLAAASYAAVARNRHRLPGSTCGMGAA